MKPMVQAGSASASTSHNSRKGSNLLPSRRTHARRCASVEQLELRCLLSTVTEFPALPSAFASEMTTAAGKLWFAVQTPTKAIGMLDPTDPKNPHFYSAGIGGVPVDITTGPDGNVWFTEPKNNAIGMINTTDPNHPITLYTSANGLPANAEPQGITGRINPTTGGKEIWFTDTINNALGMIDPGKPDSYPPRDPDPIRQDRLLQVQPVKDRVRPGR